MEMRIDVDQRLQNQLYLDSSAFREITRKKNAACTSASTFLNCKPDCRSVKCSVKQITASVSLDTAVNNSSSRLG